MKVTADTNVLIRAVMADDPVRSPIAQRLLIEAEVVAVPTVALCEFVWVLTRTYKRTRPEIARAIRGLISGENIKFEVGPVEAGLALLDDGGDFADGVIAHDGTNLSGTAFASFDRGAVRRLVERGLVAFDPAEPH